MSTPEGAPNAGIEAPVCYRHPDRETYLRCTRCQRPICPDCMISASVGFQCPDCVREANKDAPAVRTPLGGRVTSGDALVTKALIAVNVAVFLLAQVGGNAFAARLYLVGRIYLRPLAAPEGVASGEFYRLLTAAFLHQQLLHLAFNMLALWFLGPGLESLLGRARFLALYLLCAVGGTTASYLFNPPLQGSLGASGAVFGLLGASILVARRLQTQVSPLLVLLGVNLALGFSLRAVDWKAHLGGLVTGLALGAAFAYAPRARRTLVQAGAGLLVLAALGALVAWRTVTLGG